jgi:iron only hydrogenase large subunit-like protein
MNNAFHSVTLEQDKCKGCINCMKRCPTEAIRVRNGKATIIKERCIDCGECIKVCHNRAKKAVTDPLQMIETFKWKVALPAPSFYGQFNNLDDINFVLTGLKNMGFDDVYEVSSAAEVISDLTRKLVNSDTVMKRPIISSACPAVVKLISVRFPNLCAQVLPVVAPVELAAKKAREEAVLKTGYNKDEIGIFFISPCPAKVTAAKAPLIKGEGFIDGVISASEVYTKLLNFMNKIKVPEPLSKSGIVGLAWANSGGESAALLKDKYLAADGIENVIKVLEEIEDEKLNNLDFIELNACTGGCVGGVLNIENPFVAKARLLRLRKYLPISCNKLMAEESESLKWKKGLEYSPVMLLNEDVSVAMEMMQEIDEIANNLPGLDCGSCGAPSCKAFAEDIVKGLVSEDDCIIKMREKLKAFNNEEIIPAPFRT